MQRADWSWQSQSVDQHVHDFAGSRTYLGRKRDTNLHMTTTPHSPRQDLVERATPFLPIGSEIRQAFICQAAPNVAYFLVTYFTGLTMFWIKYRCVAVTDEAVYVLESTRRSAPPILVERESGRNRGMPCGVRENEGRDADRCAPLPRIGATTGGTDDLGPTPRNNLLFG